MKNLLLIAAAAAALAPFASQAESNFVTNTGSSATSASAKLNFKIVVPKVLLLQVGAGSSMPGNIMASSATVSNVTFDVPANGIGNGTAVAGTSDDLAGGAVTVRVFGNSGDVSLSNETAGELTNGVVGDPTILWSAISATSVALTNPTPGYTQNIDHPTFQPSGGMSASPTALASSTGVVRREGSWTFKYANASALRAGTYGDSAGKGLVTYTATAP